jgi:hypothetical protein
VLQSLSGAEETLTRAEGLLQAVEDSRSTARITQRAREKFSAIVAASASASAAASAFIAANKTETKTATAAVTASAAAPTTTAPSAPPVSKSNLLAAISPSESSVNKVAGSRSAFVPLDYAVWPRGGRVLPPGSATRSTPATVLTSPAYVNTLGPLAALRHALRLEGDRYGDADERVVISNTMPPQRGRCFAMAGAQGNITVKLYLPVQVTSVQLYHPAEEFVADNVAYSYTYRRDSGNGGEMASGDEVYSEEQGQEQGQGPSCSAPRRFQVLGWTQDPERVKGVYGISLGSFEFQPPAEACEKHRLEGELLEGHRDMVGELQSFSVLTHDAVSGMPVPPLSAVTIAVQSNHGHPTMTCLYRVRVLGTLAVPSKPL